MGDVDDPAENDPDGWLGVDVDIVNIAIISDGENVSGANIERTRQWPDKRNRGSLGELTVRTLYGTIIHMGATYAYHHSRL